MGKPEDLNPNGTLFGGCLRRRLSMPLYIRKRAGLTKYISQIDFVSSAKQGDIIELGIRQHTLVALSLRYVGKYEIKSPEKAF
jgi:acyl-CoA hydrolase